MKLNQLFFNPIAYTFFTFSVTQPVLLNESFITKLPTELSYVN